MQFSLLAGNFPSHAVSLQGLVHVGGTASTCHTTSCAMALSQEDTDPVHPNGSMPSTERPRPSLMATGSNEIRIERGFYEDLIRSDPIGMGRPQPDVRRGRGPRKKSTHEAVFQRQRGVQAQRTREVPHRTKLELCSKCESERRGWEPRASFRKEEKARGRKRGSSKPVPPSV